MSDKPKVYCEDCKHQIAVLIGILDTEKKGEPIKSASQYRGCQHPDNAITYDLPNERIAVPPPINSVNANNDCTLREERE